MVRRRVWSHPQSPGIRNLPMGLSIFRLQQVVFWATCEYMFPSSRRNCKKPMTWDQFQLYLEQWNNASEIRLYIHWEKPVAYSCRTFLFETMKLRVCSISFSIPSEFLPLGCPHRIQKYQTFSSFQRGVSKFNIFWFQDIASKNIPCQKERMVSPTIISRW